MSEATAALRIEAVGARRTASVAAALTGLVVGSTIVRIVLGTFIHAPWIVPDEIVYSELAKSIASGHLPAIRGAATLAFGPIYPLLIAPAWAVGGDPAHAYRLALSINAFVMSLAALPAYALARMMVSTRKAVLVAAFSVGIPSMAYTGVLMTENAYYPAFLLALLTVARALQRPTVGRQAAALAAIGLVTLVRVQGVTLLGAYLGAALLYAYLNGGGRRSLVAYRPTAIVVGIAVLLAPALSVARGEGILGWLGAYAGAFSELRPLEIPRWVVYEAADVSLYLAVAPLAASVILFVRAFDRRVASAPVRLFTALALPTLAVLLLSVAVVGASIDVDAEEVINERYLFYGMPLLLLGLALWTSEGLPRPRRVTLGVVATAVLLPVVLPINDFSYNANHQTLALVPWVLLELPRLPLALLVGGLAGLCGLLFMRVRSDRVGRVWMATAWAFIFVGGTAVAASAAAGNLSHRLGVGPEVGWIDSAVPPGTDVLALTRDRRPGDELGGFENRVVMMNEFFNSSVGEVVNIGRSAATDSWLPATPATRGADGFLTTTSGSPVEATYVVASCRLGVVGTELARDRSIGTVLYRIRGPVQVARRDTICFGLYGSDHLVEAGRTTGQVDLP